MSELRSGPQTINISEGQFVIVSAYAQSAGPQTVEFKQPNGALAFIANKQRTPGRGDLQFIGFRSFVSPITGDFTLNLTEDAAVLCDETTMELDGRTLLRRYGFLTDDRAAAQREARRDKADGDFNDLLVTIEVFSLGG